MANRVTVLIPTLGRPKLLVRVLNGLRTQDYSDFGVLLVLAHEDSEITKVKELFSKYLDIRVLIQKHEGLMEAYREGFMNSKSDIIVTLDDDSVPEYNCIREHILTLEKNNVSGVSGDVIPVRIENRLLKPIDVPTEIGSCYKESKVMRVVGSKIWNRPLDGQQGFLTYISKAGYSKMRNGPIPRKITNSLFCMSANMSVLSSAINPAFNFGSFLKCGVNWEQVLGWNLWKNGFRTVFNPRAKVFHIQHGQTQSRYLNGQDMFQASIENELVYYYLFQKEELLSSMNRIVSLLFNSSVHLKHIPSDWRREIAILRGIFFGNIIGLKWNISIRNGGKYTPAQDFLT